MASEDEDLSTIGGQTIRGDDVDTLVGKMSSQSSQMQPVTRRDEVPAPAAGGDASGTRAGDYELVKMIGRGGMGAVYRARQVSLHRDVAVKTIVPQFRGDTGVEALFVSEALVTGELEHPGIVPVHDLGRTPDGLPYLSMKLVRGVEWAKLLRPDPADSELSARVKAMGLRGHLDILLKVCDAIAFAHSREILHRDLKPANVMVGEFGEVQVMDWGIALHFGAPVDPPKALHRSEVKSPAGTPAYMPPELSRPEPAKMGPPSDVYLLGGILYEILTGSPPHRGRTAQDVLSASRAGIVEAPELRAPDRRVPAELARIAMRALSIEPADRYPTATALSEVIREFLSHEESLRLAEEALAALKWLQEQGAVPPAERYAVYAETLSRLNEALHLWPLNAEARATQARAALDYADEALERGDVGLAAAQMAVLKTNPRADPHRRDALAAALAASASARRRTRAALACLALFACVVYATLGGAWERVVAADRRDAATRALGARLEGVWKVLRAGDLGPLAAAEEGLADPELKRAPRFAEAVQALRYARAILYWQRERWEELSSLVASDGRLPAWPPLPLPPGVKPEKVDAARYAKMGFSESSYVLYPSLVELVIADPSMMPYLSIGLANGKTGELLAALGRAARAGVKPAAILQALTAAAALVHEDRAAPEERRWFALGVAGVRGQAYQSAALRGGLALASTLDAWRLPFRLTLPKREKKVLPDGSELVWKETPSAVGFTPSPPEWELFSPEDQHGGFRYIATRRAGHAGIAVPADDGTAFVLTTHAVVRLDYAIRLGLSRTSLSAPPIMCWPDPVDRSKLAVLVADDGFYSGDGDGVRDAQAFDDFAKAGGLLSLSDAGRGAPSGAVRFVQLDPGRAEWPAFDSGGWMAWLRCRSAGGDLFGQLKEPVYQRYLGDLMGLVGQDATDVHAALILFTHGLKKLSEGAVGYALRRLVPAASRLRPEDEAQAAVLLENAGFKDEARTMLREAAQRFVPDGGNPHVVCGATTGGLLRQAALAHLRARNVARAREVLEASLAFATHDPADAALLAAFGEATGAGRSPVSVAGSPGEGTTSGSAQRSGEPGLQAPGADDALMRRLSTPAPRPLEELLRNGSWLALALAALSALATLGLVLALLRGSRAARIADLHRLGLRTRRERTQAFLTHPVVRARHTWVAYASRRKRLAVACAGLTFLLAIGLASTAQRLQRELVVFGTNPTDRLLSGGDAVRVLQTRRELGSRNPAVYRVLAECHRVRGELTQARAVSDELRALDPRAEAGELVHMDDVRSAALDAIAVRRELAKALVFIVFQPEAIYARLHQLIDARAGALLPGVSSGVLAAAGAGAVTLAALLTLLAGVLAALWLPFAVRPVRSLHGGLGSRA